MSEYETNETQAPANEPLSPIQIRVLGCLIEKEIATPEYYPLTLNALVAACNQKSNRNPAMTLDDATVLRALDDLRYDHHLVLMVTTSGNRVAKYKHTLLARWGFTPQEVALLCELFLRGPQTVGELRTHAERLHPFSSLEDVEATLVKLSGVESRPFVVKLPREPGCREQRWAHLLSGEVAMPQASEAKPEPARLIVQAENERIAALEAEVATLRSQMAQVIAEFATFRKQFE